MAGKNELGKNTLLLAAGTIMTKGISFVMVPFFSRWLSTEDYGTFDVLCTYVTLLIPIISLATNEALFRFSVEANEDEDKSYYITNCLFIFTANMIVFSIVAMILRQTMNWILAPYFCFLLLGEVYNMYLRGYLRAIKRLDVYSYSNAISTIFIAIVTTIFIKVIGLQLEGILLGYACGYIVGDLIIVVWTKLWRFILPQNISINGMRELVRYSYALIPNNMAWWFINVSDRTVINYFLGAASNGIYAIAYKIPNILSSVFGVFSVSWQQSAVEALNDTDRDKYYNYVYNQMTIVLLSLCCGILSLNSWFFNYIFDYKYVLGYLYTPILISGTVMLTISQFFGGIQISMKQPKENGITTITGAVSNLIIHLFLVNFIGLFAAAISTLVSQTIVCFMRKMRLNKIMKLNYTKSTRFYFGLYIYFLIASYFINNLYFNIVNVIFAFIVMAWANKKYVIKVVSKLIDRK